jgi:hypothetical protein
MVEDVIKCNQWDEGQRVALECEVQGGGDELKSCGSC